jgi:hypothetical protein
VTNVPYIPPLAPWILAGTGFDTLISRAGVRTTWARSHTCPCVFAGATATANPFVGSADPRCQKCFGVGVYWDEPSAPFMAAISFMHMSPSPDEPGTIVNGEIGTVQMTEPSLTIPAYNPLNPGVLLPAWQFSSTDDRFVVLDMQTRFTAVLQTGVNEILPYQQNIAVASDGAVTTYDPSTGAVSAIPYQVSGARVYLDPTVYPQGTNYMVEFVAAPTFIAFRRAGGLPHIRPFGGGDGPQLPRRFRLQALDLWTRTRINESNPSYSAGTAGTLQPYVPMTGTAVKI